VVGNNNRRQIGNAIPVEIAHSVCENSSSRAYQASCSSAIVEVASLQSLGENVFSQFMSSSSLASLFLAPMLPSPVQGALTAPCAPRIDASHSVPRRLCCHQQQKNS
jgi:hypothetical protein